MNDDRYIVEAHQKVETMNAKAALRHSEETRKVLTERINQLEMFLRTQNNVISQLQNKYNLLLTERFTGGSTSKED